MLQSPKGAIRVITNTRKIGRNEKCPCGSGKKYKKCCIGKNLNQSEVYGKNKLIEYLEQGYLIIGPIKQISIITDRDNFLKVFPIDKNILENPLYQEKTLIMLRKVNDTIEIVTDDEETIKLAKQKQKEQEPYQPTVKIGKVCTNPDYNTE